MKQIVYALIMGLVLTYSLKAQGQGNLVPNAGFEDYTQCPDNWDQLNRVKDWFNVNGQTPDYWNSCDTSDLASVPYNKAGFQYAATGNAYAGLLIYGEAIAKRLNSWNFNKNIFDNEFQNTPIVFFDLI